MQIDRIFMVWLPRVHLLDDRLMFIRSMPHVSLMSQGNHDFPQQAERFIRQTTQNWMQIDLIFMVWLPWVNLLDVLTWPMTPIVDPHERICVQFRAT